MDADKRLAGIIDELNAMKEFGDNEALHGIADVCCARHCSCWAEEMSSPRMSALEIALSFGTHDRPPRSR